MNLTKLLIFALIVVPVVASAGWIQDVGKPFRRGADAAQQHIVKPIDRHVVKPATKPFRQNRRHPAALNPGKRNHLIRRAKFEIQKHKPLIDSMIRVTRSTRSISQAKTNIERQGLNREASKLGFASVSTGVVGSVSYGIGAQGAHGEIFQSRNLQPHSGFAVLCGTGGLQAGGSVQVQIGLWKPNPKAMHGPAWGVEVAAGNGVGGSIGVYFDKLSDRLLGFAVGVEAGANVTLGYTVLYPSVF